MFTLILIVAFTLASCLAAAGLIASTQNSAEATAAMTGLEVEPDLKA